VIPFAPPARLVYFVRRLLGDDCPIDDVLQEVWLAALSRLARLRSPAAFRVWLYRIARNQVCTALRRQRRWADLPDDDLAVPADDQPAFTREQAGLIHVCLGRQQPLELGRREEEGKDAVLDDLAALSSAGQGEANRVGLAVGQIPDEIPHRRGGAPDPLDQYVWDVRYIDAPVVRFHDGNTDGDLDGGSQEGDNTLYYTTDANFNVTALVDAETGDVVERYLYDPYGKVTVYEPDWSDTVDWQDSAKNEVLYCGYRFDAETGLYNVRYRYYHPTLGRWVTKDPIGPAGGDNLYLYVHDSPLTSIDPFGLLDQMSREQCLELVKAYMQKDAEVKAQQKVLDDTQQEFFDELQKITGKIRTMQAQVQALDRAVKQGLFDHEVMGWNQVGALNERADALDRLGWAMLPLPSYEDLAELFVKRGAEKALQAVLVPLKKAKKYVKIGYLGFNALDYHRMANDAARMRQAIRADVLGKKREANALRAAVQEQQQGRKDLVAARERQYDTLTQLRATRDGIARQFWAGGCRCQFAECQFINDPATCIRRVARESGIEP